MISLLHHPSIGSFSSSLPAYHSANSLHFTDAELLGLDAPVAAPAAATQATPKASKRLPLNQDPDRDASSTALPKISSERVIVPPGSPAPPQLTRTLGISLQQTRRSKRVPLDGAKLKSAALPRRASRRTAVAAKRALVPAPEAPLSVIQEASFVQEAKDMAALFFKPQASGADALKKI